MMTNCHDVPIELKDTDSEDNVNYRANKSGVQPDINAEHLGQHSQIVYL